MDNGSAIIFGSSTHGVPKDNSKEGRISIATFMTPVEPIKPIGPIQSTNNLTNNPINDWKKNSPKATTN